MNADLSRYRKSQGHQAVDDEDRHDLFHDFVWQAKWSGWEARNIQSSGHDLSYSIIVNYFGLLLGQNGNPPLAGSSMLSGAHVLHGKTGGITIIRSITNCTQWGITSRFIFTSSLLPEQWEISSWYSGRSYLLLSDWHLTDNVAIMVGFYLVAYMKSPLDF